jgi:hypothetical protein
MPKKPDIVPAARPRPTHADPRPCLQHQHRDRQHHQREQRQQLLTVEHLAEQRAAEGADDAGRREGGRDRPDHGSAAGVVEQIDRGIGRHRDRARADRDMRLRHADHIDHQRNGEHRAATADQAEREADARPRCETQHALYRGDHQLPSL